MIFVWCLLSVVIAAVLVGIGVLAARRVRQAWHQQQQQHIAVTSDWQGPYV
jgi:Tfp pilus assembly protein PilV